MNIPGFRSNKRWKKMVASAYYIFYIIMILRMLCSGHSEEVLTYGTKQDMTVETFTKFFYLFVLALPIIIVEIKYRLKLNRKKTFLCFFIAGIVSFALSFISPGHSEQYNAYLNSKNEAQEPQKTEDKKESELANNKANVENNKDEEKSKNKNIENVKTEQKTTNKESNTVKPSYVANVTVVEEDDDNEELQPTESNVENHTVNEVATGDFVWIDDTSKKYHINSSCGNMDNPYKVTKDEAIESGREACGQCYYDTVGEVATGNLVWIDDTGKKYHIRSSCSKMDNPYEVTKDEAIAMGRDACKKCYR